MRPSQLFPIALTSLLALSCGDPESRPTAGPPTAAPAPANAEAAVDDELLLETVVYVTVDGVAHRRPDAEAEASMRIAKDERYRILEQTEGWYRLETQWAEIPAWVPASAVRTARENAPAHVINERLATEP